MIIASRATPEGLAGHGLSTTGVWHGMWGMRSHPQRCKIGHYSGKNFQHLPKLHSHIHI